MAYVEQFHNLSSWREDNLTIDPHEVGVLDLLDTAPNMFVVVNPNKALLKCAISTIPTGDNYEFKVEYNCSEVFGRPTATRKLYILNDSEVKASIKIFSVNKEFDPTVLKNMNVNLKDYEIQTDTQIRGFAEGVSLPSGKNMIGYVSLSDSDKNLLSNLPNILSRTNTIDEKATTISSHLNNVKMALMGTANPTEYINLYYLLNDVIAQNITEIKNKINPDVIRSNYGFHGANATTYHTDNLGDGEKYFKFDFITNDSEKDVYINLTLSDGTSKRIVLKTNETINHLELRNVKAFTIILEDQTTINDTIRFVYHVY